MPNELGWLPIHVAINLQQRHIVDHLLNFPYPEELLQPYVDVTMTWTYKAAIDLNSVTVDGQSPLYLAVETGNVRLVEQIMARKAKAVNDKADSRDISPLQLDAASFNGETALYAAVKLKNQPIVRLLVDHGADVNVAVNLASPVERSSALAAAVRNGDMAMVNLLLAHKASDAGHHALSAASLGTVGVEMRGKILALHAHRGEENFLLVVDQLDLLIDWLIGWSIDSSYDWLIDWLIDCSIDWLIVGLFDLVLVRLIDWLIDWLYRIVFSSRALFFLSLFLWKSWFCIVIFLA